MTFLSLYFYLLCHHNLDRQKTGLATGDVHSLFPRRCRERLLGLLYKSMADSDLGPREIMRVNYFLLKEMAKFNTRVH